MKVLGYMRMTFVGEDSLGYKKGKLYSLMFFEAPLIERILNNYQFVIKDCEGNGKACPYSSVVTFLLNWES